MMWWWGDPWGAGHWVGIGFTALFWIAVVVGIVYLIRRAASRSASSDQQPPAGGEGPSMGEKSSGPRTSTGDSSGALRILEERYARGEIDREEFLQRKADLTS